MRGTERMRGPAGKRRPRDSRLRRHRAARHYLAASALPIMRANVTERPQQLPVDMFGYVCAWYEPESSRSPNPR